MQQTPADMLNSNQFQQSTRLVTHAIYRYTESKVHGANMGPIWGRKGPCGLRVGPVNLDIRVDLSKILIYDLQRCWYQLLQVTLLGFTNKWIMASQRDSSQKYVSHVLVCKVLVCCTDIASTPIIFVIHVQLHWPRNLIIHGTMLMVHESNNFTFTKVLYLRLGHGSIISLGWYYSYMC